MLLHTAHFCSLSLLTTIILHIVLYEDETWSLTQRKNRVLWCLSIGCWGRYLEPRGEEVTWDWRKLHNEELNELHCSPNIISVIKSWRMRWAGHVARVREKENAYRVLLGKPKWKRPPYRPIHKGEDNIKLYLKATDRKGTDWINVAQYRGKWLVLVKVVMNRRAPKNEGISWLAEGQLAFQEGLCPMELQTF